MVEFQVIETTVFMNSQSSLYIFDTNKVQENSLAVFMETSTGYGPRVGVEIKRGKLKKVRYKEL